jgi:hypothetical protein
LWTRQGPIDLQALSIREDSACGTSLHRINGRRSRIAIATNDVDSVRVWSPQNETVEVVALGLLAFGYWLIISQFHGN